MTLLEEKSPIVKVGEWVVQNEDGIWAMSSYSHKTKRDAIDEVSCATLDSRQTPKVERVNAGEYLYFPKDVDTGKSGNSYLIKRVTQENEHYLNAMLKEQWEEDPLSHVEEDE